MPDQSNDISTAPAPTVSASAVEEAQNRDVAAKQRGLEPPEILRGMSPEERAAFEKKLRRKIDIRLLPMIIIMYILNYIDRYAHAIAQQRSIFMLTRL